MLSARYVFFSEHLMYSISINSSTSACHFRMCMKSNPVEVFNSQFSMLPRHFPSSDICTERGNQKFQIILSNCWNLFKKLTESPVHGRPTENRWKNVFTLITASRRHCLTWTPLMLRYLEPLWVPPLSSCPPFTVASSKIICRRISFSWHVQHLQYLFCSVVLCIVSYLM